MVSQTVSEKLKQVPNVIKLTLGGLLSKARLLAANIYKVDVVATINESSPDGLSPGRFSTDRTFKGKGFICGKQHLARNSQRIPQTYCTCVKRGTYRSLGVSIRETEKGQLLRQQLPLKVLNGAIIYCSCLGGYSRCDEKVRSLIDTGCLP